MARQLEKGAQKTPNIQTGDKLKAKKNSSAVVRWMFSPLQASSTASLHLGIDSTSF